VVNIFYAWINGGVQLLGYDTFHTAKLCFKKWFNSANFAGSA
jgi:hypothetical protein